VIKLVYILIIPPIPSPRSGSIWLSVLFN